jgi:hypothetical protein
MRFIPVSTHVKSRDPSMVTVLANKRYPNGSSKPGEERDRAIGTTAT